MWRSAVQPDGSLRRFDVFVAVIGLAMVLGAISSHAQDETQGEAGDQTEQQNEFPYEVRFLGTKEETLELVKRVSETLRLIEQPPTSFNRLRRRAEDDLPRVLKAMREGTRSLCSDRRA